VVLAHPHAAFHLYICGLHRGDAVVDVVLIGYNNVKFAAEITIRKR
jgi:hypothetical protein